MSVILIIIIYLIFVSLGLPDSLIGSSWPAMVESLKVSASMQGYLTFTVAICTIISSFLTNKIVPYLKTGGVVSCSIFLTAGGLLGSFFAPNFWVLLVFMIPMGLGAGAIDTTLNNYVAIHYKAIHLNWLHAAWGVGASTSPLIVSVFLSDINGWRNAALILAIIQFSIFLISLIAVPLYKKVADGIERKELESNQQEIRVGFFKSFTIKGVMFAIIAFFSYIAIEQLTGLWFASMAVFELNVAKDIASQWTSLFYIGIVVGRIIAGVISLHVSDKNIIRGSEILLLISIILMMMTFNIAIMPVAVFICGLSNGPIYPAIIHATPNRFTKSLSANVMAIQVGCAYIANISIAPLFGIIANATTFLVLPYVLLAFFIIMAIGNEVVLIKTKDKATLLKTK